MHTDHYAFQNEHTDISMEQYQIERTNSQVPQISNRSYPSHENSYQCLYYPESERPLQVDSNEASDNDFSTTRIIRNDDESYAGFHGINIGNYQV